MIKKFVKLIPLPHIHESTLTPLQAKGIQSYSMAQNTCVISKVMSALPPY